MNYGIDIQFLADEAFPGAIDISPHPLADTEIIIFMADISYLNFSLFSLNCENNICKKCGYSQNLPCDQLQLATL